MGKLENLPKPLMSVKDVAKYLRIHLYTTYRLINEGKLPGFKVGGAYRFSKPELDQWMLGKI